MSRHFMKKGRLALSVGVALLLVFALAGTALAARGGASGDPPGLARAIAAQEAHTDALLAQVGVVGTGVSVNAGGQPVVVVFAETTGVAGIPGNVDGVPVVVYVTGQITALHHRAGHTGGPGGGGDPTPTPEPTGEIDPTARFDRPVPIGVSTGHPSITAGTIGARVTDGTNIYALSNNHVYAAGNAASVGDSVIQPGTFDGGSVLTDIIGTLAAFVSIDFSGADNRVDAAIALSSTADLGNSTPGDGYGTPSSIDKNASVSEKVQKYGRTTGLTKGRIWAINVTVNVNYGDVDGDGDNDVARFVGQLAVRGGGFSAGGDSGSLVVTQSGDQPVGLLFAGSSNATIINPIGDVLSAFGVTVDGS